MSKDTILQIMETLLNKKISLNEDVSMENCSDWDSMKHIEIILSIEEELGVSFEPEDIPSLTSVSKIIKKVEDLCK